MVSNEELKLVQTKKGRHKHLSCNGLLYVDLLIIGLTFYNLNWNESGRIPVEEVANRVNSTLEKYPVNEESSIEKFGVNTKEFGVNEESSVEKFGVNADKFGDTSETQKKVSKTAQKIIDLVISDPSITADNMANKIGVTKRAIEKNIKSLRGMGILVHEGSDKAGYWRIIVKP